MAKKIELSPKAEELMARLSAIDTTLDPEFTLILSLTMDAMIDGSLSGSEGGKITKEANRLLREAKAKARRQL